MFSEAGLSEKNLFELLIFPYGQPWVAQVQGLLVAEEFM